MAVRGLDHIVHAVRNLDAAAALYRRLGFTVGARNRHPWGTHNHVIQVSQFFVELLTFAEPDKLGEDGFSRLFAAYNRDFIARGGGLSMLLLESHDAAADAEALRGAGIAVSPAMRFEREGKRPDGSTVTVAFSLVFADGEATPDLRFTLCQQHYPENFWNPAFQTHRNGVNRIAGAVIVTDDPSAHRTFLQAFAGGTPVDADGGFSIATPRGAIDVLTPDAFTRRFGITSPDMRRGPRLAAIRFGVSGPRVSQAVFGEEVRVLRVGHSAVIGPDDALGAALIFEPADA